MVEETQQARSIVEAAIAEAATVSSRIESNMGRVTAQTEATTVQAISSLAERVWETAVEMEAWTSRTVGLAVQQLGHEIQVPTLGATVTSEMKTKSAVEGLRRKIKAHLDQNRADFD